MRTLRSLSVCLAIILVVSLVFSACAEPAPPPPAPTPSPPTPAPPPPPAPPAAVKYEIPATNIGQSCYQCTAVAATVVTKYSDKVILLVKVSTSPTGNLRLINEGTENMGYVSEIACYAGIRGLEAFGFKEKIRKDIQWIACDWGFFYPIFASEASGIKSVTDLRGKKVTGWPTTSLYGRAAFLATLEAYGVDEKDVTILTAKFSGDCGRMLMEGVVDAMSAPTLMGSPWAIDLLTTKPCVFVPVTDKLDEIAKICAEKYNCPLQPNTLPADVYPTQTEALTYLGSPDGWVCTADVPDDVIYEIVKNLWDNEEEFLAAQPGAEHAKPFTRETAVGAIFLIPYHPGAVKYYKEKGWWTAEMDAKQEQVLAEIAKL